MKYAYEYDRDRGFKHVEFDKDGHAALVKTIGAYKATKAFFDTANEEGTTLENLLALKEAVELLEKVNTTLFKVTQ